MIDDDLVTYDASYSGDSGKILSQTTFQIHLYLTLGSKVISPKAPYHKHSDHKNLIMPPDLHNTRVCSSQINQTKHKIHDDATLRYFGIKGERTSILLKVP